MRTVQQRTDHYTARMQSTLIDPTLSAVNAQQQANFQAYITEFYPYQEELRNWLNTKGVTPMDAFKYEALNGECYRAFKNFQGAALVVEFTAIHTKYTDFGLNSADIKAVMLAVWSVIVP